MPRKSRKKLTLPTKEEMQLATLVPREPSYIPAIILLLDSSQDPIFCTSFLVDYLKVHDPDISILDEHELIYFFAELYKKNLLIFNETSTPTFMLYFSKIISRQPELEPDTGVITFLIRLIDETSIDVRSALLSKTHRPQASYPVVRAFLQSRKPIRETVYPALLKLLSDYSHEGILEIFFEEIVLLLKMYLECKKIGDEPIAFNPIRNAMIYYSADKLCFLVFQINKIIEFNDDLTAIYNKLLVGDAPINKLAQISKIIIDSLTLDKLSERIPAFDLAADKYSDYNAGLFLQLLDEEAAAKQQAARTKAAKRKAQTAAKAKKREAASAQAASEAQQIAEAKSPIKEKISPPPPPSATSASSKRKKRRKHKKLVALSATSGTGEDDSPALEKAVAVDTPVLENPIHSPFLMPSTPDILLRLTQSPAAAVSPRTEAETWVDKVSFLCQQFLIAISNDFLTPATATLLSNNFLTIIHTALYNINLARKFERGGFKELLTAEDIFVIDPEESRLERDRGGSVLSLESGRTIFDAESTDRESVASSPSERSMFSRDSSPELSLVILINKWNFKLNVLCIKLMKLLPSEPSATKDNIEALLLLLQTLYYKHLDYPPLSSYPDKLAEYELYLYGTGINFGESEDFDLTAISDAKTASLDSMLGSLYSVFTEELSKSSGFGRKLIDQEAIQFRFKARREGEAVYKPVDITFYQRSTIPNLLTLAQKAATHVVHPAMYYVNIKTGRMITTHQAMTSYFSKIFESNSLAEIVASINERRTINEVQQKQLRFFLKIWVKFYPEIKCGNWRLGPHAASILRAVRNWLIVERPTLPSDHPILATLINVYERCTFSRLPSCLEAFEFLGFTLRGSDYSSPRGNLLRGAAAIVILPEEVLQPIVSIQSPPSKARLFVASSPATQAGAAASPAAGYRSPVS